MRVSYTCSSCSHKASTFIECTSFSAHNRVPMQNPVCCKVFANLFAYDQHRNHATKAGTLCASLTMRAELTGVRRVDCPIPVLHARPRTGLNGANSAKRMFMRNHCGCCSASAQRDGHVALYNLDQFRPCSKFS